MVDKDVDKRCVDGVNIRVVFGMRQYLGRTKRNDCDYDRDCDGDTKGQERRV